MSVAGVESGAGTWVVAGSTEALEQLAPLIAARRARGPVVEWPGDVAELLAAPEAHLPGDTAGLLVVGDRRRSPGRTLPGLFVRLADGRSVPVGWLPEVAGGVGGPCGPGGPRGPGGQRAPASARARGQGRVVESTGSTRSTRSTQRALSLATYARAAASVLERSTSDRTFVVLGQWEDRFLRVGLRTARWLERHGHADTRVHWTADRIARSDMIEGLRLGPAVAVYFGHGRARGWAGYHGVRSEHFEGEWPEPVAALLALCCENASRLRTGLSFAERLVLNGVCGGMMAAVAKTRHEDNRRWGPELCEAFTERRPATLAELVEAARVPDVLKQNTVYRFIGDPLIPLAGAKGAAERAQQVFAPAPDEALPPWEPLAAVQ